MKAGTRTNLKILEIDVDVRNLGFNAKVGNVLYEDKYVPKANLRM